MLFVSRNEKIITWKKLLFPLILVELRIHLCRFFFFFLLLKWISLISYDLYSIVVFKLQLVNLECPLTTSECAVKVKWSTTKKNLRITVIFYLVYKFCPILELLCLFIKKLKLKLKNVENFISLVKNKSRCQFVFVSF